MIVLSLMVSLTSCATANLEKSASAEADASLVDEALQVQNKIELPPLPADCEKKEYAGVPVGMWLPEANLRYSAALTRANSRVMRCAQFYKDSIASVNVAKGKDDDAGKN